MLKCLMRCAETVTRMIMKTKLVFCSTNRQSLPSGRKEVNCEMADLWNVSTKNYCQIFQSFDKRDRIESLNFAVI